jgi:hypothetical protein
MPIAHLLTVAVGVTVGSSQAGGESSDHVVVGGGVLQHTHGYARLQPNSIPGSIDPCSFVGPRVFTVDSTRTAHCTGHGRGVIDAVPTTGSVTALTVAPEPILACSTTRRYETFI